MTRVDQFESVFRAADKPVFHYRQVPMHRVLVVTDLPPDEAPGFGERVSAFLRHARGLRSAEVETLAGVRFRSTADLLERVDEHRPDLVCAYRNLHSDGWRWPHSLGEALDVLTQTASVPVLVLPHPKAGEAAAHALDNLNRVMAVTDHLAGEEALVNWAVAMTQPAGRLFLTHVEDERTFERYMGIIGRIAAIDTEQARELVHARLLKEPHDYIRSCTEGLRAASVDVVVEEIVTVGHHLSDYTRLVRDHEVDLLVLDTRDDDQLAMHGLAYPLAVELRHIPLLML